MSELRPLRILIACEESQTVCKEFRARGHEAYSCDLQYCSGGHPEWHIMHDAVEVAYSGCWDLMIAHPPCTYLSTVANRWWTDSYLGSLLDFERERRLGLRRDAIDFVKRLWNAPIGMKCIENPVGILSTQFQKATQMIHPYYFGDPHQKQTQLWLHNLPCLQWPNDIEKPKPVYFLRRTGKPISFVESLGRHPDRAKIRSKTFPGIAAAMAAQWSPNLLSIPESKV